MRLKAHPLGSSQFHALELRSLEHFVPEENAPDVLAWILLSQCFLESLFVWAQFPNIFTARVCESIDPLQPDEIGVIERDFKDWAGKSSVDDKVGRVMIDVALLEGSTADPIGTDLIEPVGKLP